jgi:hypothetical protein
MLNIIPAINEPDDFRVLVAFSSVAMIASVTSAGLVSYRRDSSQSSVIHPNILGYQAQTSYDSYPMSSEPA